MIRMSHPSARYAAGPAMSTDMIATGPTRSKKTAQTIRPETGVPSIVSEWVGGPLRGRWPTGGFLLTVLALERITDQ
jgi:hypothetical protein